MYPEIWIHEVWLGFGELRHDGAGRENEAALGQILRSRGRDTVIITGIATNICCETTAREASQHDFHVFFVSDGTATMEMGGVSADDLQVATCASLGQVFAEVVSLDDIVGKIAGAAPAAEPAGAAASTW